MSDSDLWNHLQTVGQLKYGWWYNGAVIPAIIFVGGVYLLVWLSLLWRKDKLTSMFVWLVIASIPFLLVFPSFYVSIQLGNALDYIMPQPKTPQDISQAAALEIGNDLNRLAWFGLAGVSLSFVVILANRFRPMYMPQLLRTVQAISQGFTKRLSRRGAGSASSPHGVIRVIRGKHAGAEFGIIHTATIGKKEATFTITDEAVSRYHARFDIRHDNTYLADLGSTNGTWLKRNDRVDEVASEPRMLEDGDIIYLGHPDEPEAVELVFEKKGRGGT